MTISSPQPSVVHLVTLFRQITAGDIRIPAFQREFVWNEKQIIELLDSVVEGFPIGSILLWGVDQPMLRIAPAGTTSFPVVDEKFPTSYVLDGMQRLSTLYGVFHYGSVTTDPRFDVIYDLATGLFSHRSEIEPGTQTIVPLAALFSPRQLLEQQARLAVLDNSDTLLGRLLSLQGAFQDYMLPVVTIKGVDVHRIVRIFEKINSTGTVLDPVDFMRAITWAEDFDLNQYLDDAAASMGDLGFSLSPETIIKCVGLTLGIPPTTDGLMQLRDRRPAQLRTAFEDTKGYMRRVAEFVADRMKILSSDYIPYEGQLLMLFRSIGMAEASEQEYPLITRWFWATGFNESLRGKPDHYVVRAVENWRTLVRGGIRGLEPRLKLTPVELLERRAVSGRALFTAIVAMHAVSRARSIEDGSVIDPSSYMDSADSSRFKPVFSRDELVAGGLDHTISARLFANVILTDQSRPMLKGTSLKQVILSAAARHDWEALHSQFIDQEAVERVAANDPLGFLQCRATAMYECAEQLVGELGPASAHA